MIKESQETGNTSFVARRYELSSSMVNRWVREYNKYGEAAFREADGWVLADYKTDAVKDESHLQELTNYYAPQLEIYRCSWEQITVEKVAECGFFFADQNRYVRLV